MFFDFFRQLLLPAAAAVKQLRKNHHLGENTVPLKDELVPKPRQKIAYNVSSEILEKQHFFRQLLLPAAAAVKQLRKNHHPGGKHRASEGRASSKTTPKNCLTCRLKSSKNNIFRQLLLPAAAAVKQLRKNHLPGGNTMPLKDKLVPKPHQKTA